MDLDVRHLRLLVAIADTGSLSGAARRLRLRQPTVTTQLQRIEGLLGDTLFERTPSGVRPTERGEEALERARLVLAQVDTVTGLVRDPVPTVRVRTFVLPFEMSLPLLGQLAPGLRWDIAAGGFDDGTAALTAGEADLLVALSWAEHVVPPGLVVEGMLDEHGWVMLPAGHPRAGDPAVPLASLAGAPLVTPPEPELQQAVVEDCRRAGFEPSVQVRPRDVGGMRAAVASGAAVAISSPLAELSPEVVLRPCPGTRRNTWALVHRRTLPADLIRMVVALSRWAYATRARANPELFASLPPDLRDAPFPEPYAVAGAGRGDCGR